MVTIGIDQSLTSTGVCISGIEDSVVQRHFEIIKTATRPEDPLDLFRRSATIADELVKICNRFSVKKAYIEGLSFGSRGDATRKLATLQGIIIDRLLAIDIEPCIIAPPSLKKFATDNGRASKEEMFDVLPEDLKRTLSDIPKSKGRYDLCDAYWLSTYEHR